MGDALDTLFKKFFIICYCDIHYRLYHGLGYDGEKTERDDIENELDGIGFGDQAFLMPAIDGSLKQTGRSSGVLGENFSDKRRDIMRSMDHLAHDHFNDLFFLRKIAYVKGREGFEQAFGGAALRDSFLDSRDKIKQGSFNHGAVQILFRGEIIKNHGFVDGTLLGNAVNPCPFKSICRKFDQGRFQYPVFGAFDFYAFRIEFN